MRACSSAAAKLSPELGGGSLTALPIAETDAGNLSAYIPTNLISITDGQIVLDTGLFAANQRPAIDVGLSVSRVGGKAQTPALRKVSGRLRLDYSQFLELEMFTRFGGLSDARVKAQIMRGERIRALITQPRFTPLRARRRGRPARRAGRRRIRRLSRRADSRDAGPACGASRCARRDGGGCVERERRTRTRSPGDARRGRA